MTLGLLLLQDSSLYPICSTNDLFQERKISLHLSSQLKLTKKILLQHPVAAIICSLSLDHPFFKKILRNFSTKLSILTQICLKYDIFLYIYILEVHFPKKNILNSKKKKQKIFFIQSILDIFLFN